VPRHIAVSRHERHPRPTGPAPTGAECRKEWDPRHTRPTATRSSVPRNLTTREDRTYNAAVLRSGQSGLRFVQPRFQRTLPNQLFRCATDRAFYGDLASMEFLPNLSRSVESICNKSTICNCSTTTNLKILGGRFSVPAPHGRARPKTSPPRCLTPPPPHAACPAPGCDGSIRRSSASGRKG